MMIMKEAEDMIPSVGDITLAQTQLEYYSPHSHRLTV